MAENYKSSKVLRLHINPDNRRVNVTDPAYLDNWVRELERVRAAAVDVLREAVKSGKIEITVEPDNPLADTPERALHRRAHGEAERTMQNWAVMRGIGMLGVEGLFDHGTHIQYVDDPSVPPFEYHLEEDSQ